MYYIRAAFIFLFLEAAAYLIAIKAIPFIWQHQSSAAFHVCVVLSVLSATLFTLGLFMPGYSLPEKSEKGTKK